MHLCLFLMHTVIFTITTFFAHSVVNDFHAGVRLALLVGYVVFDLIVFEKDDWIVNYIEIFNAVMTPI